MRSLSFALVLSGLLLALAGATLITLERQYLPWWTLVCAWTAVIGCTFLLASDVWADRHYGQRPLRFPRRRT